MLDYDAISSNDAVGVVYIDLNPLLTWDVRALDDSLAMSSLGDGTTNAAVDDRSISR